jgi:tRNA threonylcarbamoyladenosine biosynthesis protein TsaB
MIVLGIETSTKIGSIAIVSDEKVMAECTLAHNKTHSSWLLPTIEWILKQMNFSIGDLTGLAVSLGPGSFTGLRVGVGTCKGLALSLRIPIAPIPTLDVLVLNLPYTERLVCPILDARRNELYTAFYRFESEGKFMRVSNYRVISPEELIDEIRESVVFLGDGIKRLPPSFRKNLFREAIFTPSIFWTPRALNVALIGKEVLREGKGIDAQKIKPLYIHPSLRN